MPQARGKKNPGRSFSHVTLYLLTFCDRSTGDEWQLSLCLLEEMRTSVVADAVSFSAAMAALETWVSVTGPVSAVFLQIGFMGLTSTSWTDFSIQGMMFLHMVEHTCSTCMVVGCFLETYSRGTCTPVKFSHDTAGRVLASCSYDVQGVDMTVQRGSCYFCCM